MTQSSMSFSKDVVQNMVSTYGKEQAINELVGACRTWIEVLVEEIEETTE